MEVNEILCKETGKMLKADTIYRVKNEEDNCIEEIVSTCYLCPHSEANKSISDKCKNCYGTITQSKKKIKEKRVGTYKMYVENYRNAFEVDEFQNYIKNMESDKFMELIDVIYNYGSLGWNSPSPHGKLRAYDKPRQWKTICSECRKKCSDNNLKPQCKQAGEYLEDKFGISTEYMTEEQLLSDIPTNLQCPHNEQSLCYV